MSFPYKKAGLTKEQAAAHLLSRFSFGARPGDVSRLAAMGPEQWFSEQLAFTLPEDSLNQLLDDYEIEKMSNADIAARYPRQGQLVRMAIDAGVIDKDSINQSDKTRYRAQLAAFMATKGVKPQQELFRQLQNQKLLRAVYANNQLAEVMTDFWFNHFNVSATKNDCAGFIPHYERTVIRPNAFGKFGDLLLATATSPAMLVYLDNFSSSGTDSAGNAVMMLKGGALKNKDNRLPKNNKKSGGLNENYAREVMELHTLGVEGGYTQRDVTEAARILTGWTVYPIGDYGPAKAMQKVIDRVGADRLEASGFVHTGDFLFTPNRHDKAEKRVLGETFPAGGSYPEGVRLLNMLAHYPATAAFITKKLAIRFVSDAPPKSLTDKMARSFLAHDGDIREVLLTMVSSPEFWSPAALRQKTKSPFELAVSSVRGLDAKVTQPAGLNNWVTKMGQKTYYYQAPTGFPDQAQYWINTGALLNRMNFGLALAGQRIPGVKLDLLALNNHHEPESAEAALESFTRLLLPQRNTDETIRRLGPLMNDPALAKKVDDAAAKNSPPEPMEESMEEKPRLRSRKVSLEGGSAKYNVLSQVVGIIIGSPEFQRR